MTGQDLKLAVYNLTKDRLWSADAADIDVDNLIVNWVNLALQEIPPEAFTVATLILSDITGGVAEALPSNFRSFAGLDNNDTDPITSYELDEVEFTNDGKIIYPVDMESGCLYYYPIVEIADISENLPININIQICLLYFLYAQYYYQSGEGDYEEHKMADNYLARFNKIKEDRLMELKGKGASDLPVRMTDGLPAVSRGRRKTVSNFYNGGDDEW